MNKDLENVSAHIKELGIGLMSQAQKNGFFWNPDNYLDEGVFGVLQAAQAAEIFIKAAIAEQHPLLIFSNLPTSKQANGELLNIEHLFEKGKTVQYSELPELLWASTGYKLPNLDIYRNFGNLRNCVQHLAVPGNRDFPEEIAKFIYQVIDPMIRHFWGLYAIDYIDQTDMDLEFMHVLRSMDIEFEYPQNKNELVEEAKSTWNSVLTGD